MQDIIQNSGTGNNHALWQTIGVWISAFATVLIALVSLYLARKPHRIKMKVSAKIFNWPNDKYAPTWIVFSCTNESIIKVEVKGYGLLTPKTKNRVIQIPEIPLGNSTELPAELGFGDSAHQEFDGLNFLNLVMPDFSEFLSEQKSPRKSLKKVRFCVITSSGRFKNKIDKDLQRYILESYESNSSTPDESSNDQS